MSRGGGGGAGAQGSDDLERTKGQTFNPETSKSLPEPSPGRTFPRKGCTRAGRSAHPRAERGWTFVALAGSVRLTRQQGFGVCQTCVLQTDLALPAVGWELLPTRPRDSTLGSLHRDSPSTFSAKALSIDISVSFNFLGNDFLRKRSN